MYKMCISMTSHETLHVIKFYFSAFFSKNRKYFLCWFFLTSRTVKKLVASFHLVSYFIIFSIIYFPYYTFKFIISPTASIDSSKPKQHPKLPVQKNLNSSTNLSVLIIICTFALTFWHGKNCWPFDRWMKRSANEMDVLGYRAANIEGTHRKKFPTI